MRTMPIREFYTSSSQIDTRTVTCKNHPTAEYITKNPFTRSLHFVKASVETCAEGTTIPMTKAFPGRENDEFPAKYECSCSFDDMIVILEDGDSDTKEGTK